ncbi:selenocysteine insertion sequence-binding protein 2 isoform X2 [Myripristis murdjan]|uniref:selenocysteine insertion sequence-binding protein 2 isoform X2 n=1 Tax=Myripristis murdjan TaxID=586833 RepID=UPI00117607A6|nr:selenocysteine insertion sequence-binding protein 2 isoform X2 [Myripristis murdjan]
MDKESKQSSAVQASVPKYQRRERAEPPRASSSPLRLPNPYVSEQRSKGNQASLSPRQRPSTADGVPAGRGGDTPSKHGYSNSRHARGTSDADPQRDRSIRDPQAKTSKHSRDSPSQDRTVGKKTLDVSIRGLRGTRSAPNSAGRSKLPQTDLVSFEVKMDDFPELVVVPPGNVAPPLIQRDCWGPTSQSPSPQTQKPVSPCKTVTARKGTPTNPDLQSASDANSVRSAVPTGQPTVVQSQPRSSDPAPTSWANVASQPPKKPLPKETIVTSTSIQELYAEQEEGTSGKKKRRKKKKKSKSASEDVEAEAEELIHQEPPKFEDEEEFPGLAVAFTGTDRLMTSSNRAKLCNEEIQKEAIQSKSGDQNKDKVTAAKSVPTETAKKGQKAEKVSGKKSKVPVQLDIGNMLAVLEKKQQSQKSKQDTKPVILSVGGALPVIQKQPLAQKKSPWQQDKIAHNPLDSTSPLVKKGKQREVPKAKKPTPLKRVILKEREEKKQNRLLEERGLLPEKESKPANDTAAEDQCDTNATDEIGSPTVTLEDQPEDQEGCQAERDEDEERDNKETEEQQTMQALPCPANRPKIHSRKFRDYCSQMLSKDVDECVTTLLKELVRFQDRLYQKDPMKARMKRRLVMGLREVLKHLKLKKVKCVVISPNCERIQSKGGLDEALHTIIDTCREQGVPFVFALSRKALGRCVNKAVPVSLVGIFNYDGAQDHYHKMIELSSEARKAYEVMVANLELTGQTEAEQELNLEEQEQQFSSQSLAQQPQSDPDTTQPEEPEYIKLWKKMLEKECNHKCLNFEEQLSSMRLANECTELTDDDDEGS